ncbi:unnamed protein product [Brachionus calyciflorus]|uniref:Transmembrane protein n=1 Tax=Brachionus calyciflorus TaxID=104777 RepID=A0A813QZY2_9BILA|nr:unnamed protein product [Brachionus calyciflorus]
MSSSLSLITSSVSILIAKVYTIYINLIFNTIKLNDQRQAKYKSRRQNRTTFIIQLFKLKPKFDIRKFEYKLKVVNVFTFIRGLFIQIIDLNSF